MKMLLTADWHLTDVPMEEYRWTVFDKLFQIIKTEKVEVVIILGDIVDRKDRHSASLLNSLVNNLLILAKEVNVIVTAGNHDAPLHGLYYWGILNAMGILYVNTPFDFNGIMLLPFSPNPIEEWKSLDLSKVRAIMMHQTVEGALVDGDRKIDKTPNPLPIFPRGVPIYSGDVHRPQRVHNITYIGTPHPTRFSESWYNRMLLIDGNDPSKYKEIDTTTTRRAILNISSIDELEQLEFKSGDQVKIRYELSGVGLSSWPTTEEAIKNWAELRGITVASVEATLAESAPINQLLTDSNGLEALSQEQVIRLFGSEQKLSDDLIEVGISLLKGIA